MTEKEARLKGIIKYKMFPSGFFVGTYFPPAYFPKTGAVSTGHGGFRGAGYTLEVLRRLTERRAALRKKRQEEMDRLAEEQEKEEPTEEEKQWDEEITRRQKLIASGAYAIMLAEA